MSNLLMNQTDKSESLFDPALTPQNAGKKGYDYIDDVIYDFINPSDAIVETLDFVRKFKCKFGTPSQDAIDNFYFGLYVPKKIFAL